jgi:hypothetical protein
MRLDPESTKRTRLTGAALLERLDALLGEARSGRHGVGLRELEELYTSGCAEALELEAEAARLRRRSRIASEGAEGQVSHPEPAELAAADAALERTLSQLRNQLRHLRTAIEWLQEQDGAS